jgi:threonine aldolase
VGADLDVDAIASLISPGGHSNATVAIAVEQTHNVSGGTVVPLSTVEALRGVADDAGLLLHCDGARIWHAHKADGVPLSTYGRLFDSISVCLSKGLGAPVGSLAIGTTERIAQARLLRKRMGGGMRQVGVLAAAGDYALTNHLERLVDDHARATRIAQALAPFGVVDPERVRTNIIVLDLSKSTVDGPALGAAARAAGVLVGMLGPRTVRLLTHLDVDDAGIDRAIEVLTAALSG